ncbi:MAG TPA: hypothetical protein PK760_12335, partial [Flavobacteriales bacterium]|nr:hypothetical protein [Flavobacteriales bacterium]
GAPGATYYVRVWNKTSAFGTFSICAFENFPPPNDNPCGAIALTVNNGCVFPAAFTTENATTTGTTPPGTLSVPNPSCNAGPYNNDVWFTAVVPASGALTFDTDDSQLTDAAIAVYTATGTCGGNNLSLTQVGCATGGSLNGAAMPVSALTGLTPGATVYIRIWRQTANSGAFLLCARNPQVPAGCTYTLNMTDSGGDGWGGGFVTLCVGGVCTNYTVTGSLANITVGASLGQSVTVSYTPAGGFQNQVAFTLQASNGFSLFNSASPPASGPNFSLTVDATCNVPPAPIEDCLGAFQVCNSQSFSYPPSNFGNTQDLTAATHGCLLTNERQGAWIRFTTNAPGTIAFTINIGVGTDYDFGVWGPFPGNPPCPPATPPMRCNWSGTTGPTGLNYTSLSPSLGAGGIPFSRWIDVAAAGENYLLYIDNFTMNGLAFSLSWNNVPANILDCILPVEFLEFDALAKPRAVDLKWSTASENNTAFFNV